MVFRFLKAGYEKVKAALKKTSSQLLTKLRTLFSKKIDAETLEELEQVLYEADLGVASAQELTTRLQAHYRAMNSFVYFRRRCKSCSAV